MDSMLCTVAFAATWLFLGTCAECAETSNGKAVVRIGAEVLADKIRGGMLGQILGNLNGLPHEFKYIDNPGNVADYVPSLPKGARTDDDTDLEWVIVSEIERSGQIELPAQRVAELWKTHINRGIWCSNRYARDLMELGFLPPRTGSSLINPWSECNIAGQFGCESFGLMAPAMPQTAARIGLHYTHTTVDGEPVQATQLFTAMIATAFISNDLEAILDAGAATVDPGSKVASIVERVRRLHAENPQDWRATRQAIKDRWQVHGGSFRDQNGYELNTAATIAALLYGDGDLVKTLQLAFNFGWDCDNNAATSATIVGVIKGREWMNAQDWDIQDKYINTTRDKMPKNETITSFEDRVIACAKLVIYEQGGTLIADGGKQVFLIPVEPPANVERLTGTRVQQARERAELVAQLNRDLTGTPTDRARAAYLAICLQEADRLERERPEAWAEATTELRMKTGVIRNIFEALPETSESLQAAARQAGLSPPTP